MVPAILAEMTAPLIANLEKLLGTPRDGALLRYSLGSEYLKAGERERGISRGKPSRKAAGEVFRDAAHGPRAVAQRKQVLENFTLRVQPRVEVDGCAFQRRRRHGS